MIVDVQYILGVLKTRYKTSTIDWKRLLNVVLAGRESLKPVAIDGFTPGSLHMDLRRAGFRLEVVRTGSSGTPGAKTVAEAAAGGCTEVELVSGNGDYMELATAITDAGMKLVTTSFSFARDKDLAGASASVRDLESLPVVRLVPAVAEGSQ